MAERAEAAEPSSWDVLVVGGGPAGSTIAALLAERGHRVVLVEKDKHPRFHIGESLLPFNLPLLDRLGVLSEVERIGMIKYGAEFIAPECEGKCSTFLFARAFEKSLPYAYQVRRSEFDHILLKSAAAKGVTVAEQCLVTDVGFPGDAGVVAQVRVQDGSQQSWRARFLVDATGRDALLASKFGIRERNRKHSSAALFGHFTGARRLPGKAEGNISIFWFNQGWFWFIPLADGTTSVGAVCWPAYLKSRRTDLTSFFFETIAQCPAIADRLQQATLMTPITATGNFSYESQRMSGTSYLIVGDAFAFIDPMFSSGVYLAMSSAFRAADAVDDCLRFPDQAARSLRRFQRTTLRGLRTYSWFIYRATTPAFRNLFMHPRNVLRVEEALMSLLAGDVFGHSPIRGRLLLFKAIYYAVALLHLPKTIEAGVRRKRSMAVSFGETQ